MYRICFLEAGMVFGSGSRGLVHVLVHVEEEEFNAVDNASWIDIVWHNGLSPAAYYSAIPAHNSLFSDSSSHMD